MIDFIECSFSGESKSPSIAMDLMYNHNVNERGKKATRVTQTHTTPHYHDESRPRKPKLPSGENLKLLAGSLSTFDSLLGEKI